MRIHTESTRLTKHGLVQKHSGLSAFTAVMIKAEKARKKQTRITRDGFAITW